MEEKSKQKMTFSQKIKSVQEKYLPYEEKTLKALSISAMVIFIWLLIWVLLFKFCNENMLITNYINISQLNLKERIMWDLIPFNYRGDPHSVVLQIVTTILNAFIFAPFGVLFNIIFIRKSILRDVLLCFGISLSFEVVQLFTTFGNMATEDLITNTLGYFVGLGLFFLIFNRLSVKTNVILFSAFNVFLTILFILSIVTTVNAADVILAIITKTL